MGMLGCALPHPVQQAAVRGRHHFNSVALGKESGAETIGERQGNSVELALQPSALVGIK